MKFCVIGLGRFGYQVATQLAHNGMEVMAVDNNENIVASIRDQVTQAVCINVTDETSLRSINIEEMDTVIVATGESFAQSILITALLKKRLNVPVVITRAVSEIHKEILQLVGADRIVLPEQEIGMRLADNLSSPFTDTIRLSPDFSISMLSPSKKRIGKTVHDLGYLQEYNVTLIGIQQEKEILPIDPDYVIKAQDKIIVAGNNKDLEKVSRL